LQALVLPDGLEQALGRHFLRAVLAQDLAGTDATAAVGVERSRERGHLALLLAGALPKVKVRWGRVSGANCERVA
jgi:hypothetical protein